MQYGLLICKNTDNIGDDIQTYAQKRFLPRVDYYVDRESLDTFYPENNATEPVAVIMNAWYMYQKFNWPPSPYIHPLFVSMHISKNDYFGIGTDFLDGIGGEYLKQYEPIGARDISTLEILNDKNIEAYLSGCLTLTLQLDKEKEKNETVYLVDLSENVESSIKRKFPSENFVSIHHDVDYAKEDISYDERLNRVEVLLGKYQNAKCVITSRLHCALPCLALETPVLMVYEDAFEDRVKTFLPLLHYVEKKDLLNGEWEYDINTPIENKKDYLVIRNQLERLCKQFIFECELSSRKKDEDENMKWKKYWYEKAMWQKNLLKKDEGYFRKQIWIKKYEEERQWYKEQFHNYKARTEELQKYIEELLVAKSWLQNQCDNQIIELNNKDAYILDLLAAKDWLEQQSGEHEKYIAELLETKQWLENQSEIHQTELNKKDAAIDNLSNRIFELEDANAKLKHQLNLLKEDKIIQKIIKMKKYRV